MALMSSKMCPLWPLHILLLYILIVAPLLLMAQHVPNGPQPRKLKVAFDPELSEKITEDQNKMIEFQIANLDDFGDSGSLEVEVTSSHPEIAEILDKSMIVGDFTPNTNWTGSFNVSAKFLGYTQVVVKLWGRLSISRNGSEPKLLAESEPTKVSVIRLPRMIDSAFIYTVAILVSVAFINMGCIVDLDIVKATLRKPIGPAIGFCSQYLFMPLCAFGLAKLLLSHNVALQLGLFVTGCSPGGGGSNIWTYLLGGNLNLSVTMTFLSTLAAFAMMPLWTMTLGRLILIDGHIIVPYRNIATLAAGLVIPLMIGVLIRRFLPKTANVFAKMLKYVAVIFVVVIIGFGIYANLYIIKLMNDWRVLVSSFSLVTLGYLFGGTFALLARQPWPDALTVAIETGIQNTGISIFILRVTLDQPEADINTVIPVAVAIFTPVPLIIIWMIQKCILVRYGVCVPTEDPDMEKAAIKDHQNGKPVISVDGNGHIHPQINSSSAEKLLPNNNSDNIITVNVKVLDSD